METTINSYSLISVVIPVYNGEKTLLNTLSGVLKQTYTRFEIIVVDDGSNKTVGAFLQQHINDDRIKVYRTKRSNANVARNYGIEKSEGEYIAMLDADDYWLENHLSDCLKLLKESKAEGLYGSIFKCKGHFNDMNNAQIQYVRELKESESIVDYLLATGCGAQTSTLFTTAQSMKDIRWDPTLIDHQDYDFVTRFYKKYKMVAKKDPTVVYSLASGRIPHYETSIKYVEQNRQDINPLIYTEYNKKNYIYALKSQAPEKIITYFRKEATKYKEYLSYRQYILLRKPRTPYQFFWEKISFLAYILLYSLQVNKK